MRFTDSYDALLLLTSSTSPTSASHYIFLFPFFHLGFLLQLFIDTPRLLPSFFIDSDSGLPSSSEATRAA